MFLKFRSGTHGLFKELGRHDKGGGSQKCPNCGACKELVEHVLFECASYHSHRLDFVEYLKTVHPPYAFETFLHGNILDKTEFSLGEKEGILVNDECSPWYNRVGDFLVSIWDRRKKLLYTDGSAFMTRQTNPTHLECMVNGTECYDD